MYTTLKVQLYKIITYLYKRSSINYFTVLGRGHGFCDDSTEVLVLKSVMIGVGRPESKVDKIA